MQGLGRAALWGKQLPDSATVLGGKAPRSGRRRGIPAQGDATDSLLLLFFLFKSLERPGLPHRSCLQAELAAAPFPLCSFTADPRLLLPERLSSPPSPSICVGKGRGVAASQTQACFPLKSSCNSWQPVGPFHRERATLGDSPESLRDAFLLQWKENLTLTETQVQALALNRQAGQELDVKRREAVYNDVLTKQQMVRKKTLRLGGLCRGVKSD